MRTSLGVSLTLEFSQYLADACVFRSMQDGSVLMTIVMHVDVIFAVGEKQGVTSSAMTWTKRFRSRTWASYVGIRGVSTRGIGVDDFPADVR